MEIVASFHIPVRVRRRGAVRIPWTSIFNWSGWLAILAIPVILMVHDSISRGRKSAAVATPSVLIGTIEETPSGLVSIPKMDVTRAFTEPGALTPLIKALALKLEEFVPDLTTAKGRAEVVSLAYKVTRTKTYLDAIGKDVVAEMKKLPAQVDANRKEIRDSLDSLAEKVRLPLTMREAEEARLKAAKEAEEAAAALAAKILQDHEAGLLENELFDLRAESKRAQAEKERLEREERIRTESAERARLEAEGAAARREQESRAAADRAEKQLKEAVEKALRDEAASAQRVKDAEADTIRAREEAARSAENARLAEVRRREEADRKEAEAKDARERDVEHRRTFNREAMASLIAECGAPLSQSDAQSIIAAIASGRVSHVSISY